MDKKVVIATHDGMFHADDVFAVAALLLVLDTAPVLATIVRTRDEDLIRKADFVVDVGAVSDAEKNRFDHHQQGGAGKRQNGIPYASFGLVWRKLGGNIAGSSEVAAIVERDLVAPIDADDGGLAICNKIFPDVRPYIVSDFIHNIRPTWQESLDSLDAKFLEAVALARQILNREVAHGRAKVAAAGLVRKAYEEAPDKRVITLDAFYPNEETLSGFPEPVFAVSPRPDGKWNARAIRSDMSLFKNRKDFPASWAGKRDAELASITGVEDAVFCHNGRFMAVAKSKEGAIALAKLALK